MKQREGVAKGYGSNAYKEYQGQPVLQKCSEMPVERNITRSGLKQRAKMLMLLVFLVSVLGGCAYSDKVKDMPVFATAEFIPVVQQSVDQYIQSQGLPPIENKPEYTPLYEKYVVDFQKLKNYNLIATIPTNAFESGGTVKYVLVDIETEPRVKMLHLATFIQLTELQSQVNSYFNKHKTIPKGEQIAPEFYLLDFEKMGKKPVQVASPYSTQYLPIIIDEAGGVGIHYAAEIMQLITEKGLKDIDPEMDLRQLLVEEGIYVPIFSKPYYWIDNEPKPVYE